MASQTDGPPTMDTKDTEVTSGEACLPGSPPKDTFKKKASPIFVTPSPKKHAPWSPAKDTQSPAMDSQVKPDSPPMDSQVLPDSPPMHSQVLPDSPPMHSQVPALSPAKDTEVTCPEGPEVVDLDNFLKGLGEPVGFKTPSPKKKVPQSPATDSKEVKEFISDIAAMESPIMDSQVLPVSPAMDSQVLPVSPAMDSQVLPVSPAMDSQVLPVSPAMDSQEKELDAFLSDMQDSEKKMPDSDVKAMKAQAFKQVSILKKMTQEEQEVNQESLKWWETCEEALRMNTQTGSDVQWAFFLLSCGLDASQVDRVAMAQRMIRKAQLGQVHIDEVDDAKEEAELQKKIKKRKVQF